MPNFLARILGSPKTAAQRGLVYVSITEAGAIARAVPGQVVRNANPGPPWIVVNHTIEAVVVAKWPGKLWEVELLEAASDQPREGAGYTRAVAVKILRERPVAMLFGAHGDAVVRVIDAAASLDADVARELGARSTSDARDAYARAWRAWLAKVEPGSIHLESDHANTLAVFAGGTRSPIGSAFTVIHGALSDRARAVAGDAAFTAGEDDDVHLAAPWDGASDALVHAAMAFGAPELIPDADRRVLAAAWEHCFGAR